MTMTLRPKNRRRFVDQLFFDWSSSSDQQVTQLVEHATGDGFSAGVLVLVPIGGCTRFAWLTNTWLTWQMRLC